jgi:Asp-tRNA(Asn)/Glu-tRNA(Gln) amidotransferase A subunit family amidase
MAHNLRREHERGRAQLSAQMQEALARGLAYPAGEYLNARALAADLNAEIDSVCGGYDAIVTPAAPGPAPTGLTSTGNPVFCSLWTLCGVPAVTLPLLADEAGLPVGVQLVGRRGDDARLLRMARWLVHHVAQDSSGRP